MARTKRPTDTTNRLSSARRTTPRRPTPEDITASRAALGSWNGLVDAEQLKRDLDEARSSRTKLPNIRRPNGFLSAYGSVPPPNQPLSDDEMSEIAAEDAAEEAQRHT